MKNIFGNKKARILWIGAAIALLGLPACALTGETGKTGEAGGTGMRQKAPEMTAFEQMDVNNDGKVVLEEFRSARPDMSEKAFAIIDRNGNGGIERAEWYEFISKHAQGMQQRDGTEMNNIPGDPLIPPPDSTDLPLVRPPDGV